jgi:hypothetical protein
MKAQKLSHLTFNKMKLFAKQNIKVESNLNLRSNILSISELLSVRGGTEGDTGGIIRGGK